MRGKVLRTFSWRQPARALDRPSPAPVSHKSRRKPIIPAKAGSCRQAERGRTRQGAYLANEPAGCTRGNPASSRRPGRYPRRNSLRSTPVSRLRVAGRSMCSYPTDTKHDHRNDESRSGPQRCPAVVFGCFRVRGLLVGTACRATAYFQGTRRSSNHLCCLKHRTRARCRRRGSGEVWRSRNRGSDRNEPVCQVRHHPQRCRIRRQDRSCLRIQ